MEEQIREILQKFGRLSKDATTLGVDDDLFSAGLSSLATVNVMLAIEETFDIEFPDRLLTRRSFQSISALAEVVANLKSDALAS
jgi:acyl carrier protein